MTKNVKMGVYIQKTADGENNISFNFFTNLSAVDKMKFVNEVTNLVLTDNYYTVIKDMIFDFVIINIFTDIDISEISEAPNSISRIEELLETTNIVEIVKANMEEGLLFELKDAVDKNIEYRTGIHTSHISDSISKLLNTIESKISGIDTQMMVELAEKLTGISGDLTVEKLAEAYSNTDSAKKFQTELTERKEKQAQIINDMKVNKNAVNKILQMVTEGK